MSWVSDILAFLKGDAAGNFKAITSELKELKEQYRQEFIRQKEINEAQRKENIALKKEIAAIRQLEENCLQDQRILKQQYTDMLEKLVFLTRGKHKDID